jgi:hypothetical protein
MDKARGKGDNGFAFVALVYPLEMLKRGCRFHNLQLFLFTSKAVAKSFK